MGGNTRAARVWITVAILLIVMAARARTTEVPDISDLATSGSGMITGVVVDSLDGSLVQRAHIRLQPLDRLRLTDAKGRFRFDDVPPGLYQVLVDHVAYRGVSFDSVVVGPRESARVVALLVPSAFQLEEVRVADDRVVPTTASQTTAYRIPAQVLREAPIETVLDAVKLLPGVSVNGERLYFRGVGYEHVAPRIDGATAREPIKGLWILPPPDALVSADYIAGAFGGEYGQALGGVIDMQLAEGRNKVHARLAYKTDEIALQGDESFGTHHVRLSVNGPVAATNVFYSLSWSGQLTDTYLVYDRGRARQNLLGAFTLVDRMRGEQTGSFKLSIRPPRGVWLASLSAVHAASRRKPYHHHYAESGKVEFDWIGGRKQYRNFVDPDDPFVDNEELFEGPRGVPTYSRASTMLIGNYQRFLGRNGLLRLNGRVAQHDINTRVREQTTETFEPTYYVFQDEEYFALHGTFPDLEEGRSEEAGFTANLRYQLGKHEFRLGGGATMGHHRYYGVDRLATGVPLPVGSLDEYMNTFDGFAYIEDEWHTEKLVSMFLSMRFDERRISDYPGDATGQTWSPRLGFRHPMTDRSALHVQAGVLYSFPTLQQHFIYGPLEGVTLSAQRTRQVEIGLQHHFSSRVVGYLTTYVHGLSNVVFTERQAGELDFVVASLGGDIRRAPELLETDSFGVELTFDLRPFKQIQTNLSVTASRVERAGELLPWDRGLALHGWLRYDSGRAFKATTTWNVTGGTPYVVCDDARGCEDGEGLEGRLPARALVDMNVQFAPSKRRSPLYIFLEVKNVLDQKVPEFAFSTYPASAGPGGITSNNFLTYWAQTGETGGYAVPNGQGGYDQVDVGNPQARISGRSVRIGIDVAW